MYALIVILLCLLIGTYFKKELASFLGVLFQERDEMQIALETTMNKRMETALIVWYLLPIYVLMGFDYRMLIVIILLFFYLAKKAYWRKRRIYRKELSQLRFQFPIWLRQIQILLQTNTVASALRTSYEQAPELMKPDLKRLIEELKKDAIHLEPYLHFLSRYHLAEVERAMKLLYRYTAVGSEDCDKQLNRMIQTTTRWLRKQRHKRNEEEHAMYQWWGMLPLFGVTVVFMAVMFELIVALFGKGVM